MNVPNKYWMVLQITFAEKILDYLDVMSWKQLYFSKVSSSLAITELSGWQTHRILILPFRCIFIVYWMKVSINLLSITHRHIYSNAFYPWQYVLLDLTIRPVYCLYPQKELGKGILAVHLKEYVQVLFLSFCILFCSSMATQNIRLELYPEIRF